MKKCRGGSRFMLGYGTLQLVFLTANVCAFLLSDPQVPCPNPSQHCRQEMFNRVFEEQGCLGCQTGCQPGYVMTYNPRYQRDTDDPSGHYVYSGISISNTVNISQPQWICMKGHTCRAGFFPSGTGSCSWCGSGCSSCTSYHNCERCFSGFSLNPHVLPGGQRVVTCSHSDVPCPSPPDNCLHDTYVATGIGCAGCQLCEDGYVVTFNPSYMNLSQAHSGMFNYMGLQIRQGINVNEPRYQCVAGDTCRDGWYGTTLGGTLFCAGPTLRHECSHGCSHCLSRRHCTACKDGFTLVHNDATNSSSCTLSTS